MYPMNRNPNHFLLFAGTQIQWVLYHSLIYHMIWPRHRHSNAPLNSRMRGGRRKRRRRIFKQRSLRGDAHCGEIVNDGLAWSSHALQMKRGRDGEDKTADEAAQATKLVMEISKYETLE